jgi:hypothetical protein
MTPKEARNAILVHYLAVYDGVIPVALDNQPFNPPETGSGVKWVRVNVQFLDGRQASLGRTNNRRFDKRGILFIQVFTPAGYATDDNDDLAEASLDLFEGVGLGGLWFDRGRVETVGPDGEWYQQNVVINFNFSAIK